MIKNRNKKNNKYFIWSGLDSAGKIVQGEIYAENIVYATALLQRQNIKIKSIRRGLSSFSFVKTVHHKNKKVTVFIQQLAILLSSGITLLNALSMLALHETAESFQTVLIKIIAQLKSGESFSKILANYPMFFDRLTCELIASGELSGQLAEVLQQIHSYKTKSEKFKNSLKTLFFYPAMVISIAVVITLILLRFVVPQFQNLFQSNGLALPYLTQVVIKLAPILPKAIITIILLILFLYLLLIIIKKYNARFACYTDQQLLNIFIIGKLLKKIILCRCFETLMITFKVGIPIIDCLKHCAMVANNRWITQVFLELRAKIATGESLHQALENSHCFEPLIIQMVASGENSGQLDLLLKHLIDLYQQEIDLTINRFIKWLEPTLLISLAMIIGLLMVALYLPIFQLGQAF